MKKLLIMCALLMTSVCGWSKLPANFDSLMRTYGLVDVRLYDSSILVDLKYSTTDNFVGEDMYKGLEVAYVQDEIARMVARANSKLREINDKYRLLILDAARPMSVQKYMYEVVENTPQRIYVANPNKGGGRHNYGVAVDATVVKLLDDGGYEWLDMGGGFDQFSMVSHLDAFDKTMITPAQNRNRQVLIDTMRSAGFGMIASEWWHFQKYSMEDLPKKYKRLDF